MLDKLEDIGEIVISICIILGGIAIVTIIIALAVISVRTAIRM